MSDLPLDVAVPMALAGGWLALSAIAAWLGGFDRLRRVMRKEEPRTLTYRLLYLVLLPVILLRALLVGPIV